MRIRALAAQALCLCLATAPLHLFAARRAAAATSRADAAQLVTSANLAVSYTVKAARASEDPKLSPGRTEAKPFWQALKKLNAAIDKAERGVFFRDGSFFKGMGDATAANEEAHVTLEMSGARDGSVSEGLEKTGRALTALRDHYGKETMLASSASAKQSADQRAQLEKLEGRQAELLPRLDALKGKVGGNETLLSGIQQIRKESSRVSSAGTSAVDFGRALLAVNEISGLVSGWHWWWGPEGGWAPDFRASLVELYDSAIDTIDYDWDLVDKAIDVGDLDLDVPIQADELQAQDDYLSKADFDLSDAESAQLMADDVADF